MAQGFGTESLEPLIGKVLQIYKGGPESRKGKVVGVGDDYLLIDTEGEGLIYYNTDHIKSVVEDLNATNSYPNKPEDYYTRYLEVETLNDLLGELRYEILRVDRGGPESRVGRLLAVGDDYFVMHTKEDGLLYYQTHHVKSISVEANKNNYQLNEYPEHYEGGTLDEVFQNLQNYWIKINRGGPESVEGVLTGILDDYVMLIRNKEIYRISAFHIRNFSYRDPNTVSEGEESEDNNQQAQQQANDQKKKGNRK